MRSSSKQRRRIAVEVFVLLCVLCMGGCHRHDGRSAIIQNTVDELAATAKFWDSYNSDEARSYLAPAFRRAIPLLEKDGADALPMILSAKFRHGYFDLQGKVTGLGYVLTWLELDNSVRGFYLRFEGTPDLDLDLYPSLCKRPQVPNTAWMVSGGPVLDNEKERSSVPPLYKGTIIVVDTRAFERMDGRVLERKKILVGLILVDGRRTMPVQAYFDPGEKRRGGEKGAQGAEDGDRKPADFQIPGKSRGLCGGPGLTDARRGRDNGSPQRSR